VVARHGVRRADRLLRADRAGPRLRPGEQSTRARRDGDDWVLDGSKMWITNAPVADVAVIWARAEEGVVGFAVLTDSPGFAAREIKHKMSLRASSTGEITLDGVRLPEDARLSEARGLKAPLSCLTEARFGIIWGSMGAARDRPTCSRAIH
jgi:glutaryl-CoA dehydrogenase